MSEAAEDPVDAAAMRVQLWVLGALAAVYAGLALSWVPPHNRLLLPLGLLAMAGAGLSARWLGPARTAGHEPVVVWFVVTMGLLLPAVAGPPAPRGRGFVTGFLGIFCALGLWAVFRYPARRTPRAPRSLRADLRWGLGWGAFMAAAYTVIALAITGVATLADGARFPIWMVIAAYWAGGLTAGVIAGLGRPLGRWPLGSMLVGMPATGAVYGAMLPVILAMAEGGEALRTPRFLLAMMIVFCGCAGPLGGLVMRGAGNEPAPRRVIPGETPPARSTRG